MPSSQTLLAAFKRGALFACKLPFNSFSVVGLSSIYISLELFAHKPRRY